MTQEIVETKEKPVLTAPAILAQERANNRSYFATSIRRFFQHKLNLTALAVFLLIVLISIFAPVITSTLIKTEPDYFRASFSPAYAPPGTTETLRNGTNIVHWLGTDDLGRDTLVRLL